MPKSLTRIIAFLLIPCLLADPIFATGMTHFQLPDNHFALSKNVAEDFFQQEALTLTETTFRNFFKKPHALIGNLFLTQLSDLWHAGQYPFPTRQDISNLSSLEGQAFEMFWMARSLGIVTGFFRERHQVWITAAMNSHLSPVWPKSAEHLRELDVEGNELRTALELQIQSVQRLRNEMNRIASGPKGIRGRIALIVSGSPLELLRWKRRQQELRATLENHRAHVTESFLQALKDHLIIITHQANELTLVKDITAVDWETAVNNMAALPRLRNELRDLDFILADCPRFMGNRIDWYRNDPRLAWWHATTVRAIETAERTWAQESWQDTATRLKEHKTRQQWLNHPLHPDVERLLNELGPVLEGHAKILPPEDWLTSAPRGTSEIQPTVPEGSAWHALSGLFEEPSRINEQSISLQTQQRLRLRQLFSLHYDPKLDIFEITEVDLANQLDSIWDHDLTLQFIQWWHAHKPPLSNSPPSTLGTDTLDMTWLTNMVTNALKPFAKGSTDAEKSNWVYDRRIRIVPIIEQGLGLLINIVFPHLGWFSGLAPSAVFGERHTGRTIGFRIFAGLWGYASLTAIHAAGGIHVGLIHGWVFQLATAIILTLVQIRWNVRSRGYMTIDALWRILISGNAIELLALYRRMRQSHDRPDLVLFDHAFSSFYRARIWVVREMADMFPLFHREGTSWRFSPSNTLSALGMFSDAPDFFLRAGFDMTRALLAGDRPREPGGLWFYDIREIWGELKHDVAALEARVSDLKERLEGRVQAGGVLPLLGPGTFDVWQSILVTQQRWHPGVDYAMLLQNCPLLVLGDTNHGSLGIIRGLIDHLSELKAAGVTHLMLEIPSDISTDDPDVHTNTWISHRFRELMDRARSLGIEIVFMDVPREQRKSLPEREAAYRRGIYMGDFVGAYMEDLLKRNPNAKVVAATGYSHMAEYNQIPKQLDLHHANYRLIALLTEGSSFGGGETLILNPGFAQAIASVARPGEHYGFVNTVGLTLDAYHLYGVIHFPRAEVEAPLAAPILVSLPPTGVGHDIALTGGVGSLVPITPGQITHPIHLAFEPHFRRPVVEIMEENERKIVECVWRMDGLSTGQRIYLAALLFAYARATDSEHTIYGSFGGPLISIGFVPQYQFFEFRARDYDGYWAPRDFEISLEDLQRQYGFADFLNSNTLKNMPSIEISNNPERPLSAIRLIPLVLAVLTGHQNRISLTMEVNGSKQWLKVFRDPIDSVPSGPHALEQMQLVTYLSIDDFTLAEVEKGFLEAKTQIWHTRHLIGYPILTNVGYGFGRFADPRRNQMSLPEYLARKAALLVVPQLRLGHATYQALSSAEMGPTSLASAESLEYRAEAFILRARQNLRFLNRSEAEECLGKLDTSLAIANSAISAVEHYFKEYPTDATLVAREEHYWEFDRHRIPELRKRLADETNSERRESLRHDLESFENQLKTGTEMLELLRAEYNSLVKLRQKVAEMVHNMKEPQNTKGVVGEPDTSIPDSHSLPKPLQNRPAQKQVDTAA